MHAARQFIKEKGWSGDKTKRVVCVFTTTGCSMIELKDEVGKRVLSMTLIHTCMEEE